MLTSAALTLSWTTLRTLLLRWCTSMVDYNRTRTVQQLLEKTASLPPSFTIHLHLEHWVLNNGSKFTYHNQIAVRATPLLCAAHAESPLRSHF